MPDAQPREDELKRSLDVLEFLAATIAIDLANGIEAFFICISAEGFFMQYPEAERRQIFQSHPANTLPHRAMRALEERSVMNVAEWVYDKPKHFRGLRPGLKLRGIEELRNHRDVLGHPSTVDWGRKELNPFVEQGKPYRDVRSGILLDLRASINEELVANGRTPTDESLDINMGMAEMLHLILCHAVRNRAAVPAPQGLAGWMLRKKEQFLQELKQRPKG